MNNNEPIKSLSEYINRINKLPRGSGIKYVFRGQGDESKVISSSAARRLKTEKNSPENEKKHIDYINDLINKAIMKGYHQKGTIQLNKLQLLAELQHNGAATCLIDFTHSALVALYFACANNDKINGTVHIINQQNGRKFNQITPSEMKEDDLKILFNNKEDKLWIWEPSDINNRIPKQHSLFIFGKPVIESESKIIIDESSKKDILTELKEIHNIDDLSLFSDLPGFAKANNCYKLYSKDDPLDKGTDEFQKNQFSNAVKYFNIAEYSKENKYSLDENSKGNDFNLYYYRGTALSRLGEYKEAIKDLDKAIEINPTFAEAYNNRGCVNDKLGKYKEAIQDFDRAIEINPTFAEAYSTRGNIKSKLNLLEEAIQDIERAIEIKPTLAEAYAGRGLVKEKLGKSEEAIQDFDKAIEINPDYTGAYNNRGHIKFKIGQKEKAIQDLDITIKLNPQFPKAYYNRGTLKLELGRYEEALKDLDKAIEIDPQDSEAYTIRASINEKLGRIEEAIQDLNKAIEIDPLNKIAYNYRENIQKKYENDEDEN